MQSAPYSPSCLPCPSFLPLPSLPSSFPLYRVFLLETQQLSWKYCWGTVLSPLTDPEPAGCEGEGGRGTGHRLSLQCGWQGWRAGDLRPASYVTSSKSACATYAAHSSSTTSHTQSGCWVTVPSFLWNLATVSLGPACMTSWLQ